MKHAYRVPPLPTPEPYGPQIALLARRLRRRQVAARLLVALLVAGGLLTLALCASPVAVAHAARLVAACAFVGAGATVGVLMGWALARARGWL